jgi:hypothetical protein
MKIAAIRADIDCEAPWVVNGVPLGRRVIKLMQSYSNDWV